MFSLDIFYCFPGLRNMKGVLLPSNVLLLGSIPLFSWLEKHERSVAAIKSSRSWVRSIVYQAWEMYGRSVSVYQISPWVFSIVFLALETYERSVASN